MRTAKNAPSAPDLLSLAKPPMQAPRPKWKDEAWAKTQDELRQLQVLGAFSSSSSRLPDKKKREILLGRHAHDQLCARVGVDQDPPPRPAGHRPTTGDPPASAPLWSCHAPPPKQYSDPARRPRLLAEPSGPLWKYPKGRPYAPRNLAGGCDGTPVRWDW
eukprot:TRINITY_DN105460_c0_g1_i1.p1 TRINITY_DN105460_c0_g1~~TRINITY_DN105460_c0_g1_i1.p1  ORF type:complete len:160 (-),score=23.53 TRINITY_DN105460_c0_g1_i1:131-610(-)